MGIERGQRLSIPALQSTRRTLAVVGGGWAGIAAAVEATRLGASVTLYEMASQLGGRARGVERHGMMLDNGQHILIGAYQESLALLRSVGVDASEAMWRTPLKLLYPDGGGLEMGPGSPGPAFAAAVLRQRRWPLRDRLALLAAATRWAVSGFRCDPALTVAALTHRVPRRIALDLIDPLCVAALNTPAAEASAQVFLRVLKDALFSAPGSADLLLPRVDLSALLADPARRWLESAGATIHLQHRIDEITTNGAAWRIGALAYDRVVLAATPQEASRLSAEWSPEWSSAAAALRYEPIITVYARAPGVRLAAPMLALRSDMKCPAQFVFDRGQLGGPPGLLAFVVSGAQPWVDRGSDATVEATRAQARAALGFEIGPVQVLTEKRATFRCTPQLRRPPMRIAPGMLAAGDYVDGPYPATLEGAVRSGVAAAAAAVG